MLHQVLRLYISAEARRSTSSMKTTGSHHSKESSSGTFFGRSLGQFAAINHQHHPLV
jgi:hypothetical protein